MAKANDFTTPVVPANTRTVRRRDPDDVTPQAAAAEATPPAAAPTPPPAPTPPTPVPGSTAVIADRSGGTLADVLAPDTTADQPTQPDSVTVLAGMARMRRAPTDPYRDLVPVGTRLPRAVADAIAQISALTGRRQQDILLRAVLGIEPLPDDVLDGQFLALYGRPRATFPLADR